MSRKLAYYLGTSKDTAKPRPRRKDAGQLETIIQNAKNAASHTSTDIGLLTDLGDELNNVLRWVNKNPFKEQAVQAEKYELDLKQGDPNFAKSPEGIRLNSAVNILLAASDERVKWRTAVASAARQIVGVTGGLQVFLNEHKTKL